MDKKGYSKGNYNPQTKQTNDKENLRKIINDQHELYKRMIQDRYCEEDKIRESYKKQLSEKDEYISLIKEENKQLKIEIGDYKREIDEKMKRIEELERELNERSERRTHRHSYDDDYQRRRNEIEQYAFHSSHSHDNYNESYKHSRESQNHQRNYQNQRTNERRIDSPIMFSENDKSYMNHQNYYQQHDSPRMNYSNNHFDGFSDLSFEQRRNSGGNGIENQREYSNDFHESNQFNQMVYNQTKRNSFSNSIEINPNESQSEFQFQQMNKLHQNIMNQRNNQSERSERIEFSERSENYHQFDQNELFNQEKKEIKQNEEIEPFLLKYEILCEILRDIHQRKMYHPVTNEIETYFVMSQYLKKINEINDFSHLTFWKQQEILKQFKWKIERIEDCRVQQGFEKRIIFVDKLMNSLIFVDHC